MSWQTGQEKPCMTWSSLRTGTGTTSCSGGRGLTCPAQHREVQPHPGKACGNRQGMDLSILPPGQHLFPGEIWPGLCPHSSPVPFSPPGPHSCSTHPAAPLLPPTPDLISQPELLQGKGTSVRTILCLLGRSQGHL